MKQELENIIKTDLKLSYKDTSEQSENDADHSNDDENLSDEGNNRSMK